MTEGVPVKPARDTLLLSHANPEDNEFTLPPRHIWPTARIKSQ
jgi:hypothetical protein